MRDKKDSIFNSEILQQTAHLSHAEFGLFMRMAMIEDDEETQKRYENISGVFLNAYMKIEEQWKEDFKPYTEDMKAMSDYSVIYSSAAKSRKGYNQLKETLDNKKGGNGANTKTQTTIETTTTEYVNPCEDDIRLPNKTKPIKIKYPEANFENAPTQNDIDGLIDTLNEDTIIQMLIKGNLERWERYYEEILKELQTKQQLKTETPFDCLEGDKE